MIGNAVSDRVCNLASPFVFLRFVALSFVVSRARQISGDADQQQPLSLSLSCAPVPADGVFKTGGLCGP